MIFSGIESNNLIDLLLIEDPVEHYLKLLEHLIKSPCRGKTTSVRLLSSDYVAACKVPITI